MTDPAADAEQETLGGGDAMSRAVPASIFWETARLDWFSRLGVEDKAYRAYPGAGHTLDFEPDRRRYLADMVGWLSARVPSASSRSTGGSP
jgi:alpha-beta hydrolase superfamily lysophospholipase